MSSHIEHITATINDDIELDLREEVNSEALLLKVIQERVAYLLAKEPGLLFSYMYRLDVDENHVGAIVSGVHHGDPVEALAQLIYQRQLRRMESKEKYKQAPIEGWEW